MESDSRISSILIAFTIIVALYGFFVLVVAAIVRSRSSQLEERILSSRVHRLAMYILDESESYLVQANLGQLLCGVSLGVCLMRLMSVPALASHTERWSSQSGEFFHVSVLVLSLTFFTCVSLVVARIAKALAAAAPERVLVLVAYPVFLIGFFLRPLALVCNFVVRRLLALVRLTPAVEREMAVSPEEINEIVEWSTEAGEIEEDEREMIRGVFTFSDKLVREVMTPRADIEYVTLQATLQEVVNRFSETGFSRLLVIGDELDDVKGLILAKDLMEFVGHKEQSFSLDKHIRSLVTVNGNQPIDDVLAEFQKRAIHFAVVIDEHGGVDGIVTIEDMIEVLVGQIFDEYDRPEDEEEVKHTLNGELLVDGSISVTDLNELHDFRFPEGDYDTFAGFVMHVLGRIPKIGEVVEYENKRIVVEELSSNRITLLRIIPMDEVDAEMGDAA